MIKLLLAVPGIDVNKEGRDGSPLVSAVDDTELVALLLSVPSIDVHAPAKHYFSRTPLHLAAERGSVNVTPLLLAAPSIDVNKAEKNGDSYYAYLSRRIIEKPEAPFSKREFMLGSLKKPRIYNLLIL